MQTSIVKVKKKTVLNQLLDVLRLKGLNFR